MFNRSTFLLLLIFLFCTAMLSQNSVYIDEDFTTMDSISYYKKCKGITKKCLQYKTDSLTVNKLSPMYRFGKLKVDEYDQIKTLIQSKSNNTKENKYIVIKYYDSIFGFERAEKIHAKHKITESFKRSSGKVYVRQVKSHPFNEDIFKEERADWQKRREKCIEKYEKRYPLDFVHMYKTEENALSTYVDFEWIKDQGAFKNKFFDVQNNYNLLIIKSDGEYFLSGGHLTNSRFEKLLKTDDWTKFKADLEASNTKNFTEGKGIFSKYEFYHNSKHCF
ncbi:hypothetical protein JM82_1551 [Olleya sp. Hel_I_94]|jgi:hypothetical protein|nr:hypothetical protein JM82_1551 [Olleya sp. Hel_I_94]|tara:strand:+ start:503 stop:1333 length:831 start_codon:yes stop_codon:yes gene_type:complete